MKENIMTVFGEVKMPEDCEQKIRQAMAKKQSGRTVNVWRALGTVAASFVLIFTVAVCLSTEVRATVISFVETYIFPDSGVTIRKETDEAGGVYREIWVDTEAENVVFAQLREGRLYFTGNGENLDITGQIAPDQPYFYSYTDTYGIEHYMAVGYSDTIENFGVYQFFRDIDGWTNGYGINLLDKEGNRYAWIDVVWEELDIPWPMPGE